MPMDDYKAARFAALDLTEICHGAAKRRGWWNPDDPRTSKANPLHFSNKLCLIHSEVSEAMEGDRKNAMDDKLPHRPAREVELADAVIRIFDLAGGYGLDLAGAIEEKLAYNAKRADHKPEVRAAEGGKTY
jgi:NTP pyrophosphatase (non-canonical NTP hydrolase)